MKWIEFIFDDGGERSFIFSKYYISFSLLITIFLCFITFLLIPLDLQTKQFLIKGDTQNEGGNISCLTSEAVL